MKKKPKRKRTWAERARRIAKDLTRLCSESAVFQAAMEHGGSPAPSPMMLHILADQWEKAHPEVSCEKCDGNGWYYVSTVPWKAGLCEVCDGVGTVFVGLPKKEKP